MKVRERLRSAAFPIKLNDVFVEVAMERFVYFIKARQWLLFRV